MDVVGGVPVGPPVLAELVVRPALAPDGRKVVCLQLPYGYLLCSADDARRTAEALSAAADELEAGR